MEKDIMCGIFGIITGKFDTFSLKKLEQMSSQLLLLSESRGKEAAGIAIKEKEKITVLKKDISAHAFIKTSAYKKLLWKNITTNPYAIIGHSRLVTNGTQEREENNQPIIKEGLVGIHNGIIVNDADIWGKNKDVTRLYDVDTEALLSLMRKNQNAKDWETAINKTLKEIIGTVSTAILSNDHNTIPLFTNNGSLYYIKNDTKKYLIFASERYILEQFCKKQCFNTENITKLEPNTSMVIDENFTLCNSTKIVTQEKTPIIHIARQKNAIVKAKKQNINKEKILEAFHPIQEKIITLKKCSKCILPASFPGISFDQKGVCNFCKNHTPIKVKGEKELERLTKKFKKNKSGYDCIVAFSGGRDSSYGLHYIKKKLKMNPLAFTYDWGMVTDLARRNQARICGKLGVEHILISADIKKKRENIKKNIHAWLKKPELGMIPLFMAGDKQFYYHAHQLRKQNGIKNFIFCAGNQLERTEFKLGFCGTSGGDRGILTTLKPLAKLQLVFYYLKQFIKNPAYINSSIFDTIGAFYSSYILKDDYIYLYHYIWWDEKDINKVLLETYQWETATDTKTTWRIGDGTAAFYNYIYYVVAGFSEIDTFLSNQIREKVITRKKALELSTNLNKPRLDTLEWYGEVVGFDIEQALYTINAMPKKY
jgi:asparagine synthetase B (glutamine-hydrolysing)